MNKQEINTINDLLKQKQEFSLKAIEYLKKGNSKKSLTLFRLESGINLKIEDFLAEQAEKDN